MTDHQVEGWTRLGARFRTVRRTFATTDGADDVIDATGVLLDWLHRYRTKVVVVRPDRFVAATDLTGLDVPAARGNLPPLGPSTAGSRRAALTASTNH
jgi:3-(3-hydroxy-phenyl)propionate hydroxylase